MVTLTSVEAQNRFGQLLDTAQREPVAITRDGQLAAFVVSPRDMEDLRDIRRSRNEAVADLEAWRAGAEASQTPEQKAAAAALTDKDVNRMVHELR